MTLPLSEVTAQAQVLHLAMHSSVPGGQVAPQGTGLVLPLCPVFSKGLAARHGPWGQPRVLTRGSAGPRQVRGPHPPDHAAVSLSRGQGVPPPGPPAVTEEEEGSPL